MISRQEVTVPEFAMTYINAVTENNLQEALSKSTRQFRKLVKRLPYKKINYAYAEGKWTIKEMLQHIIDAERVFVYRALSFVRKDPNPLPGFDENTWAITSRAPKRNWADLVDEFKALRAATELLFASLDDEQLQSAGIANNNNWNVAGLGFVCAGHVAHHIHIIKERYLGEKPETGVIVKKKKKK